MSRKPGEQSSKTITETTSSSAAAPIVKVNQLADSFNAAPAHPTANTQSDVKVTNKFDIACYHEKVKGMKSVDINNLIENVFQPNKDFVFPKTSGRSFRFEWLQSYKWLCYSPSKDGAYCLSCVLFGHRFPGKAAKILKLFSEALTNAVYTFNKHTGHGTGAEMSLYASTFPILHSIISQLCGVAQPIDLILDTNLRKEVEDNRKKLAPIVDTVLFCGRLGLPLRGHRDDSQYHPDVGNYSSGRVGNFVESLNFRIRAGDKVLEDHLKTSGKNQTYISKTSQNKIINCCGQVIIDTIINEVKESKFFSIIADEAADSSGKEQMSLVLRFVDTKLNIREEFIAFLHCKWGLSGAQLAKLILEHVNELTLSIDDCRGQGYDGAGAVAGHINGLRAHILQLNPKALYTHCYSHRLNLSICDSLSIVEITEMLKHVKEVSNFINISQARSIPFQEYVKAYSTDTTTRKTKLADVCRTRWVDHVDGLDTFNELYVPLFHLFSDMKENESGEFSMKIRNDASSLLTLISKFCCCSCYNQACSRLYTSCNKVVAGKLH